MSIQRVALRGTSEMQQLQRHAESINGLIDGKLDVLGTVTLTANSATTVVSDNKFESTMVPLFTATTANGAAAAGGLYVSSRGEGTFTLTHANNAQTDKSFLYARLG
jgi:hypothetical protein